MFSCACEFLTCSVANSGALTSGPHTWLFVSPSCLFFISFVSLSNQIPASLPATLRLKRYRISSLSFFRQFQLIIIIIIIAISQYVAERTHTTQCETTRRLAFFTAFSAYLILTEFVVCIFKHFHNTAGYKLMFYQPAYRVESA